MAFENYSDSDVIKLKCGATVAAHRAVKLSAADTCIQSAAIADGAIGVSLVGGSSGEWIPVQVRGIAKLEAAAAITVGNEVMVQAAAGDGSIDDAAGATAVSIGVALETADADGDLIAVLLATPTVKGPANS